MGLFNNKIKSRGNMYVTDYPSVGVEPYCGVANEELNPVLDNERVAYYENHICKKYCEDDPDPVNSPVFELRDDIFTKLQAATNRVNRIKECIADNELLKKARLDMLNTYITDDQYRSCLLIPLTVMVTPATAKNFICEASNEIEKLLVLSEQTMENL